MLISLDILDRKRLIFLVLDILLIFLVNKYHIMNILAKKNDDCLPIEVHVFNFIL